MKENQQSFLLLFIASFLFASSSYSQENIVVAGGSGTGTGGSVSYSVGQIAYTSLPGSGGSVSEGIQQPYEIATLGNDEFTEISLLMTAYPNPTVDILNLVVIDQKWDDLSCNLFDSNGRLVSKKIKLSSSETAVSMQELNQGIYFLVVSNSNKTIKTFKIIKK